MYIHQAQPLNRSLAMMTNTGMHMHKGIDPMVPLACDAALMFISVLGLLGNAVAMVIFATTPKIRASCRYVLLINQCLLDMLVAVFMLTYFATRYRITWTQMTGTLDNLLCHLVYSKINIAMATCASAYNLVLLSINIMSGIVWPSSDKGGESRSRLTTWAAVLVWPLGAMLMLPFSIVVTGLSDSGACEVWANYSTRANMIFACVAFNLSFFLVPVSVMLACFAAIYARLSSSRVLRKKHDLNEVRVFLTLVFIFFFCNISRCVASMADRLLGLQLHGLPIFCISLLMIHSNCVLKTAVYALQFDEYNATLACHWSTVTRAVLRVTRRGGYDVRQMGDAETAGDEEAAVIVDEAFTP